MQDKEISEMVKIKSNTIKKELNDLLVLSQKLPKKSITYLKIDKACDHLIIGLSILKDFH